MYLKDIVGQSGIKKALKINIEACRINNKALPHILFYGFAGGGKTTFANAISNEMGVKIQESNGAALGGVKTIVPFLMRIDHNSILFIDEIHSCNKRVLDYLLTAMEQFKLTVGTTTYQIPPFTLIGATTNPGQLIKPLRDRFILKYSIQPYTDKEIYKILEAACTDISISDKAIKLLVSISKNIPRIAKNHLTLIKDHSIIRGSKAVSFDDVLYCLNLLGLRRDGLDKDDLLYLETLRQIQPAGITTLVSSTGFSRDQIENMIEPYLLSKYIIKKTPKGRMINEGTKKDSS